MDALARPRLRVQLLGGFDLTSEDCRDLTPPRRKLRALIALLALPPDAGWSREALTALLWGDRDDEPARYRIEQAWIDRGCVALPTVVDVGRGLFLRTFTVGADPTPLYRKLYDTAEQAFDAVTGVIRHGTTMEQILEAASVIEDNGFTVCDDLMHGFGGGYFPPILGSKSRPAGPLPNMTLQENMTVVIQPNPITRDQTAGVQVGEDVREEFALLPLEALLFLQRPPGFLFHGGKRGQGAFPGGEAAELVDAQEAAAAGGELFVDRNAHIFRPAFSQ